VKAKSRPTAKKGTYEDYVGWHGLEREGKKKWRRHVFDVVGRLIAALEPDETVIGGQRQEA
jgi:polyphosphate glucokinase